MRMKIMWSAVLACALGSVMWAQVRGGGAEWLTAQGDAQRTSWIRTDAAISAETVAKPDFALQWKTTLADQPRGDTSLTQGVTANGVHAVRADVARGRRVEQHLRRSTTTPAIRCGSGTSSCRCPPPPPRVPAASPRRPTRIVDLVQAAPAAGRGGGFGGGRGGYRSERRRAGRGRTDRHGATRRRSRTRRGGPRRSRRAATSWCSRCARGRGPRCRRCRTCRGRGSCRAPVGGQGGRGGAVGNAGIPGAPGNLPGGGFGRPAGVVYSVSSDGILHVLGLQSGKDMQKPAPFLPANARSSDQIAVNAMLYAATTENCGGAPNGVWAIDLANEAKPVVSWKTQRRRCDRPRLRHRRHAAGRGRSRPGRGRWLRERHCGARSRRRCSSRTGSPIRRRSFRRRRSSSSPPTRTSSPRPRPTGASCFSTSSRSAGTNHATPLFASRPFATSGAAFAPGAPCHVAGDVARRCPAQTSPAAGAATSPAAQAPPPQGAPPAGVPQGPLTTLQGAPGTPGGAPAAAPGAATSSGTRWLLVPVNGALPADAQLPNSASIRSGALVALKIVDEAGQAVAATRLGVARSGTTPVTPVIVNGVVFTLSSGRPPGWGSRRRGGAAGGALRAERQRMAKSSGPAARPMTSPLSGRSFWSATGQVYVGTLGRDTLRVRAADGSTVTGAGTALNSGILEALRTAGFSRAGSGCPGTSSRL